MEILGVVPARGGSKRLPRKNILPFLGKPLIGHVLEAMRACPRLHRLVVSTEDAQIAHVARRYGAEIPFLRPKALAQDKTPTLPVLLHLLKALREKENYCPDIVALVQATSPFLQTSHLNEAIRLLLKNFQTVDCVVGVAEVREHPYWCMKIQPGGLLKPAFPRVLRRCQRKQDLPTFYRLNGALYLVKTPVLLRQKKYPFGGRMKPYVMEAWCSLDIDTPFDFRLGEILGRLNTRKSYR